MTTLTPVPLPLPEPLASIPRTPLLFGPSPIEKLDRITAALGGKVGVWAKREDCNSGVAFGGNKVRKLEYLIPEALQQGCDTLVSVGGIQSNHTRAVAGVARKVGLKVQLIQESWVLNTTPLYSKVGNIQISRLMGVTPHLDPSPFSISHASSLQTLTTQILSSGDGKPYYIPAGASDHPLGGLGFARWAFEVAAQEQELGVFFGTVVVCAVTGSTLAGMVAGFRFLEVKMGGRKRKIVGIDASAKPAETKAQVLGIAKFTAEKIGLEESDVREEDVVLDERWHEGVYGVPGKTTIEAMKFGAETEGFITDPVYEGKSLAGLMGMIRNGEIEDGEQVLYAHLGGQLAINAYEGLFE
ncbi:1-aminocyclopropane-1-carboxylate [Mollisia scopiformis]|uniref:1-aminocyclopropane-1-carboxylate n=1 Tax=Mollisia scopiformis TaxID=149040 RepID=A0A194XC21_MOLSC|nr:1-aminocyclopropane-1-carboxylate [Mollisia scopiformis]KUJ17706.1 1-aminocyclopropane-1-carboxylate [Mollisia scopiformis]